MSRFLLVIMIAFYLPASIWGQKTYVLSVGIADYENINDLTITENDAKVFEQLMRTQGAETTLLLGKNATHVNIISALRSVFAKATSQDKMIFYFSGHGYEGGFCCYDMAASSATGAQKYLGGLSYAEMQILFVIVGLDKKWFSQTHVSQVVYAKETISTYLYNQQEKAM